MPECFVPSAEETTLPSAESYFESWQQGVHCLDTSMFQSKVVRDTALDAVRVLSWTAVGEMTGNESPLGNPAVLAISNTTSALVMVNDVGSTTGGLMWVLVIAMSILAIGCIFCSIRMFEQRTSDPPPRASASEKGGANMSSASLASSYWAQRNPASARSHSLGPSMPTSARSVQTGRALSMKIKSIGRLGMTPHASLGMYDAVPEPAKQKTGGHLFTVPVDALVDVAGKGSFVMKDTFSSLVLRAGVIQNPDGSRKIQIFQGEDATIPCAVVEPPPLGPQTAYNSLDVRGANNVLLATMVLQKTGSIIVQAQAQPELVIEGNEADLDLHVFSRDGSSKATVSCKERYPGGQEQVEIHVLPGTDSVLIVASTLAILFLCGEQ